MAKGFGVSLEEFLKVEKKKSSNANVQEIDVAQIVKQVKTLPYKYQIVVKEEVLRLISLHNFEQNQKRLESLVLTSKSSQDQE